MNVALTFGKVGLVMVFLLFTASLILFGFIPGNVNPPSVFSKPNSLNLFSYTSFRAFYILASYISTSRKASDLASLISLAFYSSSSSSLSSSFSVFCGSLFNDFDSDSELSSSVELEDSVLYKILSCFKICSGFYLPNTLFTIIFLS